MRKKIIAVSVVIALLSILGVQSVVAQPPSVSGITVYTWTDKTQYKAGETGTLKISVLNERDEPVEIHNISIAYPWFSYNAEKQGWEGNETLEGNPLALMQSNGGNYYKEVKFTIPTDGRAAQLLTAGTIVIDIGTSKGIIHKTVSLLISGVSLPVSIVALDTWMTSLIAAVVVCTIILAIVILLATRRTRSPRAVITRAPAPPPPPKPKAKTG